MAKLTDKAVVLRRMAAVREVVQAEITASGKDGGLYGRGLSTEGFAGGYLQALDDIDGALTHGYPSDHRGYWANAAAKLKEKSNAKNSPPQDQQVTEDRQSKHRASRRRTGSSNKGRRSPNR